MTVRPSGSTVTPSGVTYVQAGTCSWARTASATEPTTRTSPTRAPTRPSAPGATLSWASRERPGASAGMAAGTTA